MRPLNFNLDLAALRQAELASVGEANHPPKQDRIRRFIESNASSSQTLLRSEP
jgi:hypothetical protein